MYKKSSITVLFLFILFLSCRDNSENTNNAASRQITDDSLFHAVMEGHDQAMAKMGKLIGTIKTVKRKIDSLDELSPPQKKSSGAEDLKHVYASLQKAEAAMNSWMDAFNLDSATNVSSGRDQYLIDEKAKVETVRDSVFSALARADALLSHRLE